MPQRVFGDIPGYIEGRCFDSRAELSGAGLHRPLQAGISGSEYEGADSIVLSGGYEDDRDLGYEIIYTGHGGRDPETGEQVADQELIRGNLALVYSMENNLPVRVIRGYSHKSVYSPKAGYRYDGLYNVEDYWEEVGKSGYRIWRFRLKKMNVQAAPWISTSVSSSSPKGFLSTPTIQPKGQPSPTKLANLPKPSSNIEPTVPARINMHVGDKVKHATFGVGVVTGIRSSGQDLILDVNFSAVGSKKLMAGKANLELIT